LGGDRFGSWRKGTANFFIDSQWPLLMSAQLTVASMSAERNSMSEQWQMISDIRNGLQSVIKRGESYLPKFEEESGEDYKRRLASASWRPEFTDALEALVSRPFSKQIKIQGSVSPAIQAVIDDADRRKNNLTVFAKELFTNAVADGWSAVLVDYPDMAGAVTIADDLAVGARPYFVNIRARDVLALYTSFDGGSEYVSHMRIRETHIKRDGYKELFTNRIRVLEPDRWELWEAVSPVGGTSAATLANGGYQLISEGRISRNGKQGVPVAFLWIGQRKGTLAVKPPLLDLAHMQLELYRAGSRKDEILTYSGAPMLAVIGAEQPEQRLKTGPRVSLFVPPGDGNVDIKYIQPAAANIEQVRLEFDAIVQDMRRLAMQPVVQKAGVLTATATSVDESRSHSVLQSWGNLLSDSLNQALTFAAEYIGEESTITVSVHSDYSAGSSSQQELTALASTRQAKDISRQTYLEELSRRSILGPQFSIDDEEERLAEEGESLDPEQIIDPVTGQVISTARDALNTNAE
jgi:hypothetical protein